MKMISIIGKNFVFYLGSFMLVFLLVMTFFGQYLPFVDAELKEIKYIWDENHIPVIPPFPPSDKHIWGTDSIGRDMFSLVVLGAKETLLIVSVITVIRYLIALPLSFLAHKKAIGAQQLLSWLNGLLSYIPTIIIVILLATLPPVLTAEVRPYYLILIIALVEVGRSANMIKLEFDEIAQKEFIIGGISSGATPYTLFKKYYLPFLYGKILVYMITDFGRVMFLLGQLGFIGIFISQDLVQVDPGVFKFINSSNSWPMLLMNAFKDVRGPVWIPFYAALAMTYSIFTFNLFAKGLQNLFRKKVRYM